MYRESIKNTENTKHTVKQPRQKMNIPWTVDLG